MTNVQEKIRDGANAPQDQTETAHEHTVHNGGCCCHGSDEQEFTSRSERMEQVMAECEQESGEKKNDHWCIQEIYRCARLGAISVEVIKPFVNDKGYRSLLLRQYSEYNALSKEIEVYCTKQNIEIKGSNPMNKFVMFMTTAANTLRDKSNSKLSEIMIQGINMGIISITKVHNWLSDNGKRNDYADRMMFLLQQNLEDLKLFL